MFDAILEALRQHKLRVGRMTSPSHPKYAEGLYGWCSCGWMGPGHGIPKTTSNDDPVVVAAHEDAYNHLAKTIEAEILANQVVRTVEGP